MLFSPQPLCTVASVTGGGGHDSAHSGLREGRGNRERSWKCEQECLNVEGRDGRLRVVHSDPAATIKIGGVRCLHSSLCKSHQPEPFFYSSRLVTSSLD